MAYPEPVGRVDQFGDAAAGRPGRPRPGRRGSTGCGRVPPGQHRRDHEPADRDPQRGSVGQHGRRWPGRARPPRSASRSAVAAAPRRRGRRRRRERPAGRRGCAAWRPAAGPARPGPSSGPRRAGPARRWRRPPSAGGGARVKSSVRADAAGSGAARSHRGSAPAPVRRHRHAGAGPDQSRSCRAVERAQRGRCPIRPSESTKSVSGNRCGRSAPSSRCSGSYKRRKGTPWSAPNDRGRATLVPGVHPTTVRRPPARSARRCNAGNSVRQGSHQEAQTFTTAGPRSRRAGPVRRRLKQGSDHVGQLGGAAPTRTALPGPAPDAAARGAGAAQPANGDERLVAGSGPTGRRSAVQAASAARHQQRQRRATRAGRRSRHSGVRPPRRHQVGVDTDLGGEVPGAGALEQFAAAAGRSGRCRTTGRSRPGCRRRRPACGRGIPGGRGRSPGATAWSSHASRSARRPRARS